jgi:hypothetical protein
VEDGADSDGGYYGARGEAEPEEEEVNIESDLIDAK